MQSFNQTSSIPSPGRWLKTYYLTRAAFSIVWIVAAISVAKQAPAVAAILLVAYPAWDALANYLDAQKTGGLGSNPTQFFNLVVSTITLVAMAVALALSMSTVIIVFGAWAILSGLLQLATAVRRWKSAGAQWVMVLSGAQSALAGAFFSRWLSGRNRFQLSLSRPTQRLARSISLPPGSGWPSKTRASVKSLLQASWPNERRRFAWQTRQTSSAPPRAPATSMQPYHRAQAG